MGISNQEHKTTFLPSDQESCVKFFEECYTLLVKIEAILNSRSLTPYSSDSQDLSVLTPSHCLVGDLLLQSAEKCYLEAKKKSS